MSALQEKADGATRGCCFFAEGDLQVNEGGGGACCHSKQSVRVSLQESPSLRPGQAVRAARRATGPGHLCSHDGTAQELRDTPASSLRPTPALCFFFCSRVMKLYLLNNTTYLIENLEV